MGWTGSPIVLPRPRAESLRKLMRYGIVDKRSFPEVPPRVEYRLTRFGGRFAKLLDGIDELQRGLDAGD